MGRFLVALLATLLLASPAAAQAAVRNPILGAGADPWMVWHDGRWIMTVTVGSHLELRSAPSIGELADAAPQTVWPRPDRPPENARRDSDFWAPELHRLQRPDGAWRWYVYYSAGAGSSPTTDLGGSSTAGKDTHRMFVLESDRDDPTSPYEYRGSLYGGWGIDMTVHRTRSGQLIALWSGHCVKGGAPVLGCQALYLAKLRSPWQLDGPAVQISHPTLPWESVGQPVNEGPEVVEHGRLLHVLYSASFFATDDYKLGRLTVPADADLTDPATWRNAKDPVPIFRSDVAAHVLSPGHIGIFRSPDGRQDWIVYHATREAGANLKTFGAVRSPRLQRLTWTSGDLPILGRPVATDRSFAAPAGDATDVRQAEDGAPKGAKVLEDRTAVGERTVRLPRVGGTLRIVVPRRGRAGVGVRVAVGPGEPSRVRIAVGDVASPWVDLRRPAPGFMTVQLPRTLVHTGMTVRFVADGAVTVDELRFQRAPASASRLVLAEQRLPPRRTTGTGLREAVAFALRTVAAFVDGAFVRP